MQFSENWLRQYVNPTIDSQALEDALTMAGLEVESRSAVAESFSGVKIGAIISAGKHPDADRLQICQVDVGLDAPLQIVCGAPNARVGIKVPCALVGAALPSIAIKQAKVRGVESFGMLCSAKELGLAEEASGLLELPDSALIGQDVRDFLHLDDQLFTLKLTPNRADCLSILGVARDVAAITGAQLQFSDAAAVIATTKQEKAVKVTASRACASYFGRVITGINSQATTPEWMRQRIERSGLRCIHPLVDITNYVLLALGQPLHAFDLATLNGDITVRYAQANETLLLLNESTIKLASDDLVIADSTGPIALAGIMGGEHTAVNDTTQAVFLESAFFTPDFMAGKARRLGLSTDSSYRFERGVDFGRTQAALDYATDLILQICGGQAGPVTRVVNTLPERQHVHLRYQRMVSVLGITIAKSTVAQLLMQLGFSYQETVDGFDVQAPSYRFDIAREEDLIEEVARLYGYDSIPATKPVAVARMLPAPEASRGAHLFAERLSAQGYQEIVTYSFTDVAWERDLVENMNPITLKNPIASNMSVMRSHLWGGLLDVLSYNINRKQARAMLFEIGPTFHPADGHYREESRLAGLCYGNALPEQWATDARPADFFDVKAVVTLIAQHQITYRAEVHPALHPGQSARIYKNEQPIGWLGKLHPKWQQHYHLQHDTFLFELALDPLKSTAIPRYQDVSKFLPVRRDIAIVVDAHLSAQTIIDRVHQAHIPLLREIQLFDIYQGKGIAENKKSLAFLILIQDTHKTLVDNEADAAMAKLLNLLENQFQAQLRN